MLVPQTALCGAAYKRNFHGLWYLFSTCCLQVYHLPSKEAADSLGVSLSRLKRSCRAHKVVRWPHRKLSSLVNLEETISNDKGIKPQDKMVRYWGCL